MKSHSEQEQSNHVYLPVRFELHDPTARSVCVAGSFNQWHATAKRLHAIGHGEWTTELALKPGSYEYCFVVDGRWIPDPKASGRVANPYGGSNSILVVSATPEGADISNVGQNGPSGLERASNPGESVRSIRRTGRARTTQSAKAISRVR